MSFITYLFTEMLPVTDVTVVFGKKGDKITLAILPKNETFDKLGVGPLTVNGTPEEIDSDIDKILSGVSNTIAKAITNKEAFEKQISEAGEKKDTKKSPVAKSAKKTPATPPPPSMDIFTDESNEDENEEREEVTQEEKAVVEDQPAVLETSALQKEMDKTEIASEEPIPPKVKAKPKDSPKPEPKPIPIPDPEPTPETAPENNQSVLDPDFF